MSEPKITTTIVTAIASFSLTAKLVILAGLVFMGANSYAITIYRKAKEEGQDFTKLDYLHCLIGGFFSGSIFFLLCLFFIDNEIVAWVSAGIGAYMGFAGITKIGDMLVKAIETRISKQ